MALSVGGSGLVCWPSCWTRRSTKVVGAKGRQDAERSAVSHGHEAGQVTLDGLRVPVKPRACGPPTGPLRCRCGEDLGV